MDEQLTKRERRLLKKEEQKNQQQASIKKKKSKNIGVMILILAVIGFGIWYVSTKEVASLPGEKITDLGNEHIESISSEHIPYNTIPPTSGPHTGLAPWGISNSQIPDENQVHNLEDGGVGIQYYCPDGCDELIVKLGEITEDFEHVFMGPYTDLDNTIALTAWGRIDKFNDYDEERIRSFIKSYEGIDHHAR